MNGLEAEYDSQTIQFLRLDAAEPDNEALQRSYGLRGHPTVAIVDANGDVASRFIGGQSAEVLRSAIESVLRSTTGR